MAPFHMNVIRSVFAAGEHIAPGLTGRAAFELFCRTTPESSMTPGEKRAVKSAREFMAEARHHSLTLKSGGTVAAHEFRPDTLARRGKGERETVLVVHGWRSRTEFMRGVISGLREAGYRVVSLDLPGHGGSSGRRLNMANAVDAVRTAADWFGPFTAIVGHSFGGAVAINAAAGSVKGLAPVEASAIVTIASPGSIPAVFANFEKAMGVGPQSAKAVEAQVAKIAGRPLSEFESREMLARLPVPTLVIHDEDDKIVPVKQAGEVGQAGQHVSVKLTKGLGHARILNDDGVIGAAVGFVSQNGARPFH